MLVYIQIQYIIIVHGNSTIQISDFAESCTKKNALNKLARMSRVRHNAKSIENRYNSFKIFTKWGPKLFETFCPLHERPRHFEKDQAVINILFCRYRRLEIGDWKLEIADQECCSLRTGCLRVRDSLQPSPHVFDFRFRPNRRLNSHWLAEAIGNCCRAQRGSTVFSTVPVSARRV